MNPSPDGARNYKKKTIRNLKRTASKIANKMAG
jgi:hypothetical protein